MSEILPYLKVNRLAYFSVINVDKRHKIMGPVRNDIISHNRQDELPVNVNSPSVP